MQLDNATRTALEAAAFRRLVEHLRERTDVQNIDLMNLAGFCRNCLSNWYREAAEEKGLSAVEGGEPRDRLRHALRRVAGEIPGRGVRRRQGRIREKSSRARLTLWIVRIARREVLTFRGAGGTPGS